MVMRGRTKAADQRPLHPHSFDDIKKEACFVLGLLAVKPEYQAQIASAGALPGLIKLVKDHKPTVTVRPVVQGSGGVARRAADAITNLAHENMEVKVRRTSEPLRGVLRRGFGAGLWLDLTLQAAACR